MAHAQSEALRTPPRGLRDAGTEAELSDGQLLARFDARRDARAEHAFATLVRRHGPLVLRVCRQIVGDPHLAEDAFQATFLVLARKAGSIRRPELLAHWLYGVALRTAREARMRDDRRRRHETPVGDGLDREPTGAIEQLDSTLIWREQFDVLHEEVARLPERYRAAVVLCGLEGLTHKEAARRLRCPVGTIGARLTRARERLRDRLMRRGVVPSAALLGAVAGAELASAAMPAALVSSTTEAATWFVASEAAKAGLVRTPVVALTEAVLRTMGISRLKLALNLVLAIGVTTAVGWVVKPGQRKPLAATALAPVEGVRAIAGHAVVAPAHNALLAPATTSPLTDAPIEPADTTAEDQAGRQVNRAAAPPVVEVALRDERALGERLFAKEWVAHDPMSHGGNGLGPVYNASSCVACHGLGGPGGAGPDNANVVLLSITPLKGSSLPPRIEEIHPGFSAARSLVLHRYGTDPAYASWRRRLYESRGDDGGNNVRDLHHSVESRIRSLQAQTGQMQRLRGRSMTMRRTPEYVLALSERNPPALFGAGQIDAIPSQVLSAVAESQPHNVRGRVNHTPQGQIGRFGWKAQVASLHEFVRAACANELGLEVPGHPEASSPVGPQHRAPGLDMNERECDALVAYLRGLPGPAAIDPTGPKGSIAIQEGRRIFGEVGCAVCHKPTLGPVRGIYSDLLLHDMGGILNDSGIYYQADSPGSESGPGPRDWRTPPLWGFRDTAPYMHDGRAETLDEAVALHDGQGKAAARAYFTRPPEERDQVEAFLKSLVAPSWVAVAGVLPAADIETRLDQEEKSLPESLVRQRRRAAEARDQERWRETQRQRSAQVAASRAQIRFPMAKDLERMGKLSAARDYYFEIARDAPETEEGRLAAQRLGVLEGTPRPTGQ
jgi:RNA polymerase sigma factor (sigma-70 family)